MDNKAFLSLGSNIGKRNDNLKSALKLLSKNKIKIIKKSSIYKTTPMYNLNQSFFYNMVIEIRTKLLAMELLREIKVIETIMGRDLTAQNNMPRVIDIDILTFNNIEINSDSLVIPHNKLSERKFVLFPWEEIATNYYIPNLKKSIKEILESLNDDNNVEKLEKEFI